MREQLGPIWRIVGELLEHKRATDIRLDRLEKPKRRPPTRAADLWPLMAGLAIFSAVMSGKITTEQALTMLSRLAGGP